jgi:hypothetical protein
MEILAVCSAFNIGIRKAVRKMEKQKEKGTFSEGSSENSPENKESPKESINPEDEEVIILEDIKQKLEEEIEEELITVYVNRNGLYKISGKGQGFNIIRVRNKESAITPEEFMKYCMENGLENEKDLIKEMLEEVKRVRDEITLDEITGPEIGEELRKLGEGSRKKDKGKNRAIEDEFEEKDINTGHNLSPEDSESEKESEKESQISTEENESEPEQLNIAMALKYNFKCDFYDGKEDPNDWIDEFKRISVVNNWVDNDNNDCDALKMSIIHLKGDAKEWYNSLAMKPTRFSGGVNNNVKLTEMLKANFPRQEIKEIKAQNFENI